MLLILYIGMCIVNFILNKYYFYLENACPFFMKTFCLIDFYFNFYLVYNVEAFLMVFFFYTHFLFSLPLSHFSAFRIFFVFLYIIYSTVDTKICIIFTKYLQKNWCLIFLSYGDKILINFQKFSEVRVTLPEGINFRRLENCVPYHPKSSGGFFGSLYHLQKNTEQTAQPSCAVTHFTSSKQHRDFQIQEKKRLGTLHSQFWKLFAVYS